MRMKRYSHRPTADYRCFRILPSLWREQKLLISDVFFDKSSGTIDLEFDSFTRSLQSTGCLTRSFKFESSKGPLTWQHDGVFGKGLQLLDTEKKKVTTFSNAELVPGKITKVQIIGGEDITRAWLEEILISSLAVLEWKRRIGFIGGLSMIDAKRMTRRVVAAVAGLPEATRQILEGKNRMKTEGETGRELKVVTGYEAGRLTREESTNEREKMGNEKERIEEEVEEETKEQQEKGDGQTEGLKEEDYEENYEQSQNNNPSFENP